MKAVVEETKAEIEKESGNRIKITSGRRAIAEVTKFVGALSTACQVISPLLSFVGAPLPFGKRHFSTPGVSRERNRRRFGG